MSRLILLAAVLCVFRANHSTVAATMLTQALDFEVFGRVQGVFFRKFTKAEADKLQIRGWCRNTATGTVIGHLEGDEPKIKQMMKWLSTQGSPKSEIKNAKFSFLVEIRHYNYEDFRILRDEPSSPAN